MTAIVGVLCRNGVVIGTDSSVTLTSGRQRTVEQLTEKLSLIGDRIIIAGTGPIGLGQRFCALVEESWSNLHDWDRMPALQIAKVLSNAAITDLSHTFVKPGQYGALMAFSAKEGPCLCEFDVEQFQPELKSSRFWYCSMGSAQTITDSFLAFVREVIWKEGWPTLKSAIFAVTWTLDHAVAINPGGVNSPVRIAVLEQKGETGPYLARMLTENELVEHRLQIEEAKQELRRLRLKYESGIAMDVPKLE